MGPAPSQADSPLGLDGPAGRPAGDRGHRDPVAGRPSAQWRDPEAGLAVVVGHRRHRGPGRLSLAGVPAALRHRAHLSPVQADAGLDLPEGSYPRGGRPLDLADHHRFHPAPARPPTGGRPPPAVGETEPARQAHSRPCPPSFSAPPPDGHLSRPSTETLPPRTGTATGPQEHPTNPTPRRAHHRQIKHETEEVNDPATTPHRLKIKLEVVP
ncbi:hypothetical protein SBRY_50555 [Actinacidiphila bryophytorum]|uniref:Uncharacterized protein n=1 Tax=Actinacidiphila bryophytorum TaxID=1436133 RepID=A0A9W4H516_9ACTN|nr:hypothetical protein SBRY_50555 [Actinacidiphila bryophytorum]